MSGVFYFDFTHFVGACGHLQKIFEVFPSINF